MSIPAYKNVSEDKLVLPTYNASVSLSPGQYVVGTYYAFLDDNHDYEKTADYTTLPWVEANQIRYTYPENLETETPVVPPPVGIIADGSGTADSVAYWVGTNMLESLSGITVDAGAVENITAVSITTEQLTTTFVKGVQDDLLLISADLPATTASAIGGNSVSIEASAAVDGTGTHDPESGGNINLIVGSGVNEGSIGQVVITDASTNKAGLKVTSDGLLRITNGTDTGYGQLSVSDIFGKDNTSFTLSAGSTSPGLNPVTGTTLTLRGYSAADGTDTHTPANGGNINLKVGDAVNGGIPGKVLISDSNGNFTSIGCRLTGNSKLVFSNPSDTVSASSIEVGNMKAGSFTLSNLNTAPDDASATGTKGEIRVTADALYVCVNTDTWVKTALATWA